MNISKYKKWQTKHAMSAKLLEKYEIKTYFSFPQKVPILPVSEDLEGSCPYGIDNNDDNRGSVSSTITDDQTTMRASCSDILQQNRWVHSSFKEYEKSSQPIS